MIRRSAAVTVERSATAVPPSPDHPATAPGLLRDEGEIKKADLPLALAPSVARLSALRAVPRRQRPRRVSARGPVALRPPLSLGLPFR